jgi:hypothetical protein
MQELSNGPTMAQVLNKALIRESLEHDFDTQAGFEMDTAHQVTQARLLAACIIRRPRCSSRPVPRPWQ